MRRESCNVEEGYTEEGQSPGSEKATSQEQLLQRPREDRRLSQIRANVPSDSKANESGSGV